MKNELAYKFIDTCLGNLEEASEMIEQDPSILHTKTDLGETPLHWLAIEDQLDIVKFLHSKGAHVNTASQGGYTPLSEAASLGLYEMVKFLLENGATVEGAYIGGDPILHEAARSGNPDVVNILIEYGADINSSNFLERTVLHESASDDEYLEVTKCLILKGVDVNSVAAFNQTPLLISVSNGAVETGKYLVQCGANIHLKDANNNTARDIALKNNYHELADFLLKYGE